MGIFTRDGTSGVIQIRKPYTNVQEQKPIQFCIKSQNNNHADLISSQYTKPYHTYIYIHPCVRNPHFLLIRSSLILTTTPSHSHNPHNENWGSNPNLLSSLIKPKHLQHIAAFHHQLSNPVSSSSSNKYINMKRT